MTIEKESKEGIVGIIVEVNGRRGTVESWRNPSHLYF